MPLDKMLKRPYKIEAYNPVWKEKFEQIHKDIHDSFGNKALSIEHVGSTSIPGMSAKAVIDVCVTIDHIEPFIEEKNRMIKRGYKWEDDYIGPDSILFYQAEKDDEKKINIHVCVKGSYEIEKFIYTSDYLRAHPKRVQMYNDLKEKLYREFPEDYPSYRAGKQGFLKETLELARKWKLEQNL